MKNTFGTSVSVTLFGESHGPYIGATLDGIAPGIKIDRDYIARELEKRRPSGRISTARVEADAFEIISGEHRGYTTGAPLTVIIPNTQKKSTDYDKMKDIPRPSHADLAASFKYHSFEDKRGGGHFSGRITAALVAVGAILKLALSELGISVGTHIHTLHGVRDRDFLDYEKDISSLSEKSFPTLSDEAEKLMTAEIEAAAKDDDSVGGILETVILGMPVGVGEPWFDTVEGVLAHAIFSIPAIKGVEFGCGFDLAKMRGSEANDPIAYSDGRIVTLSNNSGGILGGITNGMPILMRAAVKPTPSIYKEQKSIDLLSGENTVLQIEGRHDPAIIHRARAVVDAVCAIAISDLLAQRFGTDYLHGERK